MEDEKLQDKCDEIIKWKDKSQSTENGSFQKERSGEHLDNPTSQVCPDGSAMPAEMP